MTFRNPKLISAMKKAHPHLRESGLKKIDRETHRLVRKAGLDYLRDLIDESDPNAAELLAQGKELNDKQIEQLEECDCSDGSAADQIRKKALGIVGQQFELDISELHPSDVTLK
jgi:hypothetical protein